LVREQREVNQGLFESLTGKFMDGSPVEGVPVQARRMRSVMDHLQRLFNTREDTLPHLQGYGLPDMSQVYRNMPDGIEYLRERIRQTVERYEPRLTKVKVTRQEGDTHDGRLLFVVSARMRDGGLVRFQTTFTSTGASSVAPWRRAE